MPMPDQFRAARALLGMKSKDVAEAADVSWMAYKALEKGAKGSHTATRDKVQAFFEARGVVFIENDRTGGRGVRMRE
jgi:DNA-binding XRE family transcriptional regulator